MRVLICGGRDFDDMELMRNSTEDLPATTVIVHGGAFGADRLSGLLAKERGYATEVYPADWDTYGKSAGFIRNRQMALTYPDLCIAFWDGKSKGTKNMIQLIEDKHIEIRLISY